MYKNFILSHKNFIISIVAGLASTLVFLSVMTGGKLSVILVQLIPLPLIMIGLSLRFTCLLIGCCLALTIILIIAPSAILMFTLLSLLPTILLVYLTRLQRITSDSNLHCQYCLGSLISWITIATIGLMIFFMSHLTTESGNFETEIRHYVVQLLDQIVHFISTDIRDSIIVLWSAIFPAMLGSAWLVMVIINGALAQWMVTKAGHASIPTPDYLALELPFWILIALVIAITLSLTVSGNVGYVLQNIAVILMWPQIFAGLAIIHQTLHKKPNAGILLALFYMIFFVMFGWAQIVVAGLGLIRYWKRIRQYNIMSR
ncbi:MAG: DUF2232 domain-containing protein [Rhodospirillaceae bacterium]|jgi:hypothetical protein|nr:DUF2232 domain-containing protein [Rhodospirillaceae bacterium]